MKPNKIFINHAEIMQAVEYIALSINEDYQGKEICFIGVLKGASIFMADLVRLIDVPMKMDFVTASSYGNSTESSGKVRIKDMTQDITGKNVIIVEDIIDTGNTLHFLKKYFEKRNPDSVRIAVLLDKAQRREIDVKIDYRGFVIPDIFVIGYGMDYAEKYRNLPDIIELTE